MRQKVTISKKKIHSWITNLFLAICFSSSIICCGNPVKKDNPKELFYYRNTYENGDVNTSFFERLKILKHKKSDVLIEEKSFILKGNRHTIKMYTNYFNCPIDAQRIYFELDSIGIFFTKSIIYYDYSVLICTNDSINNIIERGLENVIFYNEFQLKDDLLIK